MATNEEIVIKAAMSILGSRTSAAKKRSSRLNGAKRKTQLWGTYHCATLCCTGTKREMENKVENERRGEKYPLRWQAKPISSRNAKSGKQAKIKLKRKVAQANG